MRNIYDWLIFGLGLLPLFGLAINIYLDNLGAEPIEAIHAYLGKWTLRWLCLSLALTPVRKITRWQWPATYRRMIGLYTFFYASLHVLNYLWVDQALVWSAILQDIIESPYIIMGIVAYSILLLMALTSTKAWQKRLGHFWKKLHRLLYWAAPAAVVHYFWQLKGNLAEPLLYATLVALLLGFRVVLWWRNKRVL